MPNLSCRVMLETLPTRPNRQRDWSALTACCRMRLHWPHLGPAHCWPHHECSAVGAALTGMSPLPGATIEPCLDGRPVGRANATTTKSSARLAAAPPSFCRAVSPVAFAQTFAQTEPGRVELHPGRVFACPPIHLQSMNIAPVPISVCCTPGQRPAAMFDLTGGVSR